GDAWRVSFWPWGVRKGRAWSRSCEESSGPRGWTKAMEHPLMTPVSAERSSLHPVIAPTPLHTVAPGDDVAVAVQDLAPGQRLRAADGELETQGPVPRGHKVALRAVRSGELVRKFGWPIGRVTQDIAPGAHVHTANLATRLEGLNEYVYRPSPDAVLTPAPATNRDTFMG